MPGRRAGPAGGAEGSHNAGRDLSDAIAGDERDEAHGPRNRRGRRSNPAGGGSVYDIRLSDAAFRTGVKAIYVQSLQLGSIQTIRRAATLGLRVILGLDRAGILALLDACRPDWHEGPKKFFIQLSREETDLIRDVRRAIGWVDPDRAPKTVGETLALGLLAGSDEAAVAAHLEAAARDNRRRRDKVS